jgi:peptidoglycan-associated lipoprotein
MRQAASSIVSRLSTVAIPLTAALALAACASKPVATPAAAPVASALPAYLDPNSEISQKRSVYFAFDSSSFRAEDKAVVELQGRYLAQHADVHVQVSGNTDERGGSEYNLALGQRRAQSVKSALELLGVKDGQVEAVSYGKEKPKATGHDEAAWAQNRRADVIYPSR